MLWTGYLSRLVQKGYKVAIAEQMEDPKLAKGLVKREVIRVVTPGTITSSQALDETKEQLPDGDCIPETDVWAFPTVRYHHRRFLGNGGLATSACPV